MVASAVKFLRSIGWPTAALTLTALVLASGAGFLTATALGIGAQAPIKTTTVTLSNGAPGPVGPAGPKGDPGSPGAESCPTGSTFTAVVLNTPGGHLILWACVAD